MRNDYADNGIPQTMKRMLFFSLTLLFSCSGIFSVQAQEKVQEPNRITNPAYLQQLLERRANDVIITSEHVSSVSGVRHVYVRQAINGIEVQGTESSIHYLDSGEVLKTNVNLIDNLASTARNAAPGMTASQAIQAVASQMGYGQPSNLAVIDATNDRNQVFNTAGISKSDIPTKLMYYFTEDKEAVLVWELSINEINSTDWWNFRVDAMTGEIIGKDNFTVTCNIKDGHDHSEHESGLEEIIDFNANLHDMPNYVEETVGPCDTCYEVFAVPIESPYFGVRTEELSPADLSASPFGWHDTNGAAGNEFTVTEGNNVNAYEQASGYQPDGGANLDFSDSPWDIDYSTGNQYEDAAITNLFYWNNIIHDITYQYGFDEASGNFQENNYGNGGTGGDSVNGEAQDSAGTCNATFGTPSDGGNPEMSMFICGDKDGDYDNLVIGHEYAHGISNRLTGGRFVANGLQNAEQMGEGWSDFYGYMLTMDAGNSTSDRTVGTYLFDQGGSGPGIRNAPYSTSLTTNPWTYAGVANTGSISQPHGIGFIWASMLYEMTQSLITQYGFDADLYNGTGGNNIAIMLVTEGLKLQPTSPGFVDGRDAILAADLALYGGANQCLIWTAFAKRGLGFSASQGASTSRTDGTEAFDMPPAQITLTRTEICASEGVVTGLGGGSLIGGVYSGTGVTDDGNGSTFSFDAGAVGPGTYTITYTEACSGTNDTASSSISVTDGTPELVCQNVTVTLDGSGDASILNSDVIENILPDTTQYTVDQTGTFNVIDISGANTGVSLPEDGPSGLLPIGFEFSFFGNDYTGFYLQSNGFLSFDNSGTTGAASWTPVPIPNASGPNNMIAFLWDDMSPQENPGVVRYATTGVAPNRILVVDYINVRRFTGAGTGAQVTTQLQLFEGSHRVEVHTTASPGGNPAKTQGIENADGSVGYAVSGRNDQDFTILNGDNDVVRFTPVPSQNLAQNCGNAVTVSLSQSDFTCADIGDNIITVTADDGNGGIATCDATVTVVGPTVTYTGGAWSNGTGPDAGTKAMFDDDYDTAAGNITACSCEVTTGNTVTVGAGEFMDITGDITVGGTLTVEHQGSVVQTLDNATVTNNGTINVNVTTPTLGGRDFMIMGSPMTGETREDVFAGAFRVRRHLTDQFELNADVTADFGAAINFADDNNTTTVNWVNQTGALNPGEGYWVRPQTNGASDATYDYVHNTGTLNTGNVSFTTVIGPDGAGNGSPNIVANPYPSAISATAFMTANGLGEIYFWEHNTQPSTGFPGQYTANFTMDDISIINSAGVANPAATGGSTPTDVLSSMQGFGFKAPDADAMTFTNAMRTTDNNNTLRDGELVQDIVRLNVMSTNYERGATTTVAFLEEASANLDEGLDNTRLANIVSIYTHLEDGSHAFGIQSRELFTNNVKIPVGFQTLIEEETEYKITLADIQGVNLTEATAYLIDNYKGTITNLNESDYEFSSNTGRFDARFTLQFKSEDILNTSEVGLEGITIYPNPTNGILNIVSGKAPIMSVEVYDVQGRSIANAIVNNQGQYQIDLSRLETAMYFISVHTAQGSITKRVIRK